MGELGNFYCVNNGCARITWRPYQKKLRYRYPNDANWTYVDGDDYTISSDRYCLARHRFTCDLLCLVRREYEPRDLFSYTQVGRGISTNDKILEYVEFIDSTTDRGSISLKYSAKIDNSDNIVTRAVGFGRLPSGTFSFQTENGSVVGRYHSYVSGTITGVERIDSTEECFNTSSDCVFKIFKNGIVIYQETRLECPEVEVIDCQLSDIFNEIKVKKFPFLERVEVVDYSYVYFGLNVFRGDIPNHCLNIYKNNLPTIVPLPGGIPTATNTNEELTELIAQICSDEGCPPPEFEVSCDCDCRECPDGTCATVCDGHVCCNDIATGQLIESIPLEEYCQN